MRNVLKLITYVFLMLSFNMKAQNVTPVNIVILGDSNIWLAGDSCNNHKGWVAWFKDIIAPQSCISYARSGASWSHTDKTKYNTEENIAVLGDDNVIYNQIARLADAYQSGDQAEPDLIIVAAGGNDAWFNEKRPMEFSETVDEVMAKKPVEFLTKMPNEVLSLSGAIRLDATILKALFPGADIVFLTSTPMVKVEPEMLNKVSTIIERTGKSMGIPTLRLDLKGPISRDEELQQHVNTYDGVHTNETGAEKVGTYVASMLKPMLKTK